MKVAEKTRWSNALLDGGGSRSMFVLCPLVGYFLQCGPYNTIVEALFTQGGVGVVMGL